MNPKYVDISRQPNLAVNLYLSNICVDLKFITEDKPTALQSLWLFCFEKVWSMSDKQEKLKCFKQNSKITTTYSWYKQNTVILVMDIWSRCEVSVKSFDAVSKHLKDTDTTTATIAKKCFDTFQNAEFVRVAKENCIDCSKHHLKTCSCESP